MRKILADWRLLIGFSALLFLIVAMGSVGIFQMQALTRTIEKLGQRYFPMQKTTLEMKNSNNLYAMGIRNYVFWKSSRYLEAARSAANLETIQKAAKEFNSQLAIYASYVLARPSGSFYIEEHNKRVKKIADAAKELQATGSKIITLADQGAESEMVNRAIMIFESQLFKVNGFLDVAFQEFNLGIIKEEIELANARTSRAILLLKWALVFGILIGAQTAGVVYVNRRRERQRRERLVQQMIILEEEERRNLSFQVHDQMGQDLSALRIYLDLVDKKITEEDKEAKKNITEGRRILTDLMNKAHNISELLRPPALDEIGLEDTIAALVFQYKQITDINFSYQKPKKEIKIPSEHSLVLYRLAQESLTNIVKHAQAKNVSVLLEPGDKSIRMIIRDDGKGFSYSETVKKPDRRKTDRAKMGILSLKERIELLGGSLEIKTALDKGTKITAWLPV